MIAIRKDELEKQAQELVQAFFGVSKGGPPTTETPLVQMPGFAQRHAVFGVFLGRERVDALRAAIAEMATITDIEFEYGLVAGAAVDLHGSMAWTFKKTGVTYSHEFVAIVDVAEDGRLRDLKMYFDTANFMNAYEARSGTFTDVRGTGPSPEFLPDAPDAGAMQADIYNAFHRMGAGEITSEQFFSMFADDIEIVFKSDINVIPYAGNYRGQAGLQKWIANLLSIWSLNAFNFTRVFVDGNRADFQMHELHYYNNPDGSRRYLDVYIVQSWTFDAEGRCRLFKSYHDSDWLRETHAVTDTYRANYGYPAGYGTVG